MLAGLVLSAAAAAGAFCAAPPVRMPAPGARIRLHRALRAPPARAAFRSFDELEAVATAYLRTLNETALNDPTFPSPLSYKELQKNGRVDLVEGCMQFGGYVKVSELLGGKLSTSAHAWPLHFSTKVSHWLQCASSSSLLSAETLRADLPVLLMSHKRTL